MCADIFAAVICVEAHRVTLTGLLRVEFPTTVLAGIRIQCTVSREAGFAFGADVRAAIADGKTELFTLAGEAAIETVIASISTSGGTSATVSLAGYAVFTDSRFAEVVAATSRAVLSAGVTVFILVALFVTTPHCQFTIGPTIFL